MILKNFDFDLKNYIDIDLLINLNSTSEDEIDRIIEKLPDDNDNIEHKEGTNLFEIRYDEKQKEKDNLFAI